MYRDPLPNFADDESDMSEYGEEQELTESVFEDEIPDDLLLNSSSHLEVNVQNAIENRNIEELIQIVQNNLHTVRLQEDYINYLSM